MKKLKRQNIRIQRGILKIRKNQRDIKNQHM